MEASASWLGPARQGEAAPQMRPRDGGLQCNACLHIPATLGLEESLLVGLWLLGDGGLGHPFPPQAGPLRPCGAGAQGGGSRPQPYKNKVKWGC